MIALLLALACTPSIDEPADIAYDHVACDHCGMMVSDPRYAAQISTPDGERFEFDDPACAFRYIAEKGPSIRHVWFRDATAEAESWLDWQQVAFVKASGTPMNGGLGAVPLGTDGAISFSAASSRVLSPVPSTGGMPAGSPERSKTALSPMSAGPGGPSQALGGTP